MRFTDFLKTAVLACAAAATALAALAIVGIAAEDDPGLLVFAGAWWTIAAILGAYLGRSAETLPPIARLLASARSTTSLPEQDKPGRVLTNRLWPLFVMLVASGVLGLAAPQIPAIAAGFTIIWSLYWRRQGSAVTAIEERDGVAFFVERTSPVKPMQLLRTPGFRRVAPPALNGSSA